MALWICSCGMQSQLQHMGSSSWPETKPRRPALGAHRPSRWTAREVPEGHTCCFFPYGYAVHSVPLLEGHWFLCRYQRFITEKFWFLSFRSYSSELSWPFLAPQISHKFGNWLSVSEKKPPLILMEIALNLYIHLERVEICLVLCLPVIVHGIYLLVSWDEYLTVF